MTSNEIPNATSAISRNRSGSVAVRATNMGLPIEIRFERSEYRYGAQALADEILRLTKQSAVKAKNRMREVYAEAGMADEQLDLLGLPDRRRMVEELDRMDEEDTGQTTWMRPV